MQIPEIIDSLSERPSQRSRLFERLKQISPDILPLPEVVDLAGFQYGARIKELREELCGSGYEIQNEPGIGFRLVRVEGRADQPVTHPSAPAFPPQTRNNGPAADAELLFSEVIPRRHRDDG